MGWLGYAGAAGALFLLTGCGIDWNAEYDDDGNPIVTPDAQYAAVCMDQRTGNRLDDDACGDWDDDGIGHTAGTYFLWMPMSASNAYIPPVGGHFTGQTPAVTKVPKGTPVAKGTPKTGGQVGAVQRGGFGVKSGTAGGSKAGAAAGKAGSGSGGKSGGS
jgi:hypothetical protein